MVFFWGGGRCLAECAGRAEALEFVKSLHSISHACAPQRGRRIHRAPRTPPGLLYKAYGRAAFVKTTACPLEVQKYLGICVFEYARAFVCSCAGVVVVCVRHA